MSREDRRGREAAFREAKSSDIGTRELAYLGDAVFELMVREMLIEKSIPFGSLNHIADKYVNAKAQAEMYHKIFTKLTNIEQSIIKRGRNLHTSSRTKSACMSEYRHATGLEVLFGYLYLNGETDRLKEVFEICTEQLFKEEAKP